MNRGISGSNSYRFGELLEEDILTYAKDGNINATEYLLSKYKGLVEGKARSYFLTGADHDDIIQEGMIGLFKAIRDYRTDRFSGFRAFAEMCVTRQIISAVKSATRQKHMPLNRYVSLHNGSDDYALIDILPDRCVIDPEKMVLGADVEEYLSRGISQELSDLEARVLQHYMQGMSYGEIASILKRRCKSIDNALQRAKRKIEQRAAGY